MPAQSSRVPTQTFTLFTLELSEFSTEVVTSRNLLFGANVYRFSTVTVRPPSTKSADATIVPVPIQTEPGVSKTHE